MSYYESICCGKRFTFGQEKELDEHIRGCTDLNPATTAHLDRLTDEGKQKVIDYLKEQLKGSK